jgi:hypothetical protein
LAEKSAPHICRSPVAGNSKTLAKNLHLRSLGNGQFPCEAPDLLNDGRAELLDAPRLVSQLVGLERTVSKSGKELIGPALNVHDDVANAVAGALVLALAATPSPWEAERFLIHGAPTPLPKQCILLFAVLVAGKHGDAGIAYFAPNLARPLVIIDWEAKDLTPAVLTGIPARLSEFSTALRAYAWSIFTTKALAQEFYSLGHAEGVEVADGIIAEDDWLLRLSALLGPIAARARRGRAGLITIGFIGFL